MKTGTTKSAAWKIAASALMLIAAASTRTLAIDGQLGDSVPGFNSLAAAMKIKLPKIKPVKFPSVSLGTSSAIPIPFLNTTGVLLNIVSLATSGGDFSLPSPSVCVGQLAEVASCEIEVQYTPSRAGASKGSLTIDTTAGAVKVSLSGAGIVPRVLSASPKTQLPFAPINLGGTGLAPNAPALATFTIKPAKGKPIPYIVPAQTTSTGSSVTVVVPPIFDLSSG